MPCGEQDWIREVQGGEDPFVEEDDGGGKGYPCSDERLVRNRGLDL